MKREDSDGMGREYAALLRQYGRVQAVCSELAATQHARIVRLEADIMMLRAQLLIRDTALACARDDMAQLQAAIPGLPKRLNLVRRVASLSERIDVLMGERMAQAMQARRAADLVICQTGCVSHGAYWRVHEHCRRTGKQCVLVDQPQAMHFVRSVGQAVPPVPAALPESVQD